jgi:FkbM family methyltransferase
LKKVHEDDFNAFKLLSEERPQLFLDIGANAGMSALSIFLVKPNAKVISFEPNPIHYSYLDNIRAKFDNFRYHKFGLGNEEKTLNFYYPIYNGRKMTALGSFEYDEARNWLNPKRISFFDESKLEIKRIEAKVKTLDSLDLDPEFIKMDVEGFEYQVLLGGKKTIDRTRPIFLIEGVNENSDVHNFFKRIDYCLYGYSDGKFTLNDFSEINNFLIPREKLHLIKNCVVGDRESVTV